MLDGADCVDPKHQTRDNHAGIDVSLELSSICVVDSSGKIVRETKVASGPEALLRHFADLGLPVIRVGLEAGPLSQWLRGGLVGAGFEVVLLETRDVKAALSAMTVKTDRKDARGIAQLLRMGWHLPVHDQVRGRLASAGPAGWPQALQAKLLDVAQHPRNPTRLWAQGWRGEPGAFEARIRDLIEDHDMLATVIGAMLQARAAVGQNATHGRNRPARGATELTLSSSWLDSFDDRLVDIFQLSVSQSRREGR